MAQVKILGPRRRLELVRAALPGAIRAIFERIAAATGIPPQDIEITIFETPRHAWGIRGAPGDELGLDHKVEV